MDEAEALFRSAIAIGQEAFGSDHPLTRRYESHYARLLLMTGRIDSGYELGRVALATHESTNGSGNAWTKDSARVTCDALDVLGRTDESRALREKFGIGCENEM